MLSTWVRIASLACAICGLIVCLWVFPSLGKEFIQQYPDFRNSFLPWLIFLWVSSIPCFGILYLVWKVADAIESDTVFTHLTAKRIHLASTFLLDDVCFFFLGNVMLVLLNMSHPSILLLSLLVDMLGVTLALFAAVLSRYITKAAVLQEDAEGTI
jgi:hypothetical protein